MRCHRIDNRSNRGILLDIERRLETVERILIIMADKFEEQLARLQSDVTAESDQITAAENLLNNLASEIRANANDPTALSALADGIEAKTAELAAAISANTPADPGASSSGPANGPANGDPNTDPAPADGTGSGDVAP